MATISTTSALTMISRALVFLVEFLGLAGFVAAIWLALIFAHAFSGQPGTNCTVQVEC